MSTAASSWLQSPTAARLSIVAGWGLALWIAYVFLWYLQYKFTGHPGSVHVFQTLEDWSGLPFEPGGRIGVGVAEMIAALLALLPATRPIGGMMTMGIMGGAIFFHLFTPLGVDPFDDGGKLFTEACVTFTAGLTLAVLGRDRLRGLVLRVIG